MVKYMAPGLQGDKLHTTPVPAAVLLGCRRHKASHRRRAYTVTPFSSPPLELLVLSRHR
ncbi:hypothetical protein BDR05DRAFT_968344 [Suillus weaverae]|nr:hypothetical protein BDR05DRAFT_968344 [Suillus weaverae]